MAYRVVYGGTMPAWEQTFSSKRQAQAFANKQQAVGDRIFSIRKVVPGEPPQSMTAAIDAAAAKGA